MSEKGGGAPRANSPTPACTKRNQFARAGELSSVVPGGRNQLVAGGQLSSRDVETVAPLLEEST